MSGNIRHEVVRVLGGIWPVTIPVKEQSGNIWHEANIKSPRHSSPLPLRPRVEEPEEVDSSAKVLQGVVCLPLLGVLCLLVNFLKLPQTFVC